MMMARPVPLRFLALRFLARTVPFGVALVLALAGVSPLAAATEKPDPRKPGLSSGEGLKVLIERIKLEQAEIRTLEAHFVQRQENEFLLEPEESRGVFSYASPNRVRWEYLSPKPITMIIDETTLTTWYRDLERVEEMRVGKYSERILRYLGASNSMTSLLEYFDVRAAFPNDWSEPYRLELTPRFERIAKKLRSLTIWIDPQAFIPQRLRYEGGDGSVTEYIFTDLTINAELPPDRFQLALPEGVEVRVLELDRAP